MMKQKAVRIIVLALLYVAVISFLLPVFFMKYGVYVGVANVPDMIEWQAKRPFVYRTLLPTIVRFASAGGEAGFALTGQDPSVDPARRFGWYLLGVTRAPEEAWAYAHAYGVAAAVVALCYLGFGLFMGLLIRHVYPHYPRYVSQFAPLMALAAVPLLFFRYGNKIYDPMTLFMFALCVYLIVARKHIVYWIVFPLAVLNKETAILLIPIFLLREWWEVPRWKTFALTAWQIVAFVAIKFWLRAAFSATPGSFVEFHLFDHNLGLLATPGLYLKFVPVVIPVGYLLWVRWKEKPLLLRQSFVLWAVVLFVTAMLFGWVEELRGYYELYPFVILLAVPSVVEAFGMNRGASEEEGTGESPLAA